ADGPVEWFVGDAIEPGAVVHAATRDGVLAPDQLVEKRVALVSTVGDPCEAGVLPRNTDAGVAQHHFQEAGLPFREAEFGDGCDRRSDPHPHTSPATPPPRTPLRPPPLRPPIRAPNPL